MSRSQHFTLVVKEGSQAGEAFELVQEQQIIGRDPSAQIRIEDDAVSRRHARLTQEGENFFLEDLGSSNGTFLNGKPVRGRVPLRAGDEIRLGQTTGLHFVCMPAEGVPGSAEAETRLELPQTISGEMMEAGRQADLPRQVTPPRKMDLPQLVVNVSEHPAQVFTLRGGPMTIGRADDNDIVISSQIVSRRHARLEPAGSGYRLVVQPEASNRLLFNGRPLEGPHLLHDGDEISVESVLTGMQVSLVYRSPSGPHRPASSAATLEGQAFTEHGAFAEVKAQPPVGYAQEAAGQEYAHTTIGEEPMRVKPAIPPRLVVTVAGSAPQTHTLTRDSISLGRAGDNDIVIASQIVSRHHARLERAAGGYQLVILPGVINTLVCQGKPVSGSRQLQHGDVLRIDSEIPGMMVSMTYQSPSEAAIAEAQTIQFGERDKVSLGRDPANDVQLNVPTVSRFHAEIERVGRRYRLTDLRSSNGTFVNGERIQEQTWLQPEDSIRIGPYRFVMGENVFTQYDETRGLHVEAYGLNKWVRKDLNILGNISLVFQPREFIVVVGQSGGGKSTLVDAIAGYRPATHGKVLVNGIDVYRNFDAIRNEIGFVPQRDIIHMELTVYQALDYAAKLRMPADTTKEERHKRVMEVLEDLDLTHRKDVQISGLSGGQQKRVSIGVELLTRPGLFFLDEPTSGLDPGTETAFMHLMRRLADQGRTIVMVTHATKNVMLADKVVFLARGGYLAWFGPPEEALAFFDQYRSEREQRSRPMEFDQIYAILDDPSKGSAQEWAQRFMDHPAYQKYIVQPLQSRPGSLPLAAAVQDAGRAAPAEKRKEARRPQVSALRQLSILSARNLRILTRDRSSLILMLLAAPLVGALDLLIAPMMGKNAYDFNVGDPSNAAITLFLVLIYSLLVAGLSQMREIVKEADIYRRERLVNLRIFPYVLSKVWVAVLLAFYHTAVFTILHHIAFDMPGGAMEFGLFYVSLGLCIVSGMVGGILTSALAPTASSAPLIMILMLVPQIVLSGALAPVPGTVSAIASTRWAFEGLIGITGIGKDVAADACWKLPDELRDAMTLEDKEAQGCRCMGMAVFEPGSCEFPGLGEYYKAELDQPEPVEPPPLGEKPAEPVIPPAPDPPEDQFDQVAVAQYLNALQAYQDDVARIQDDYKNQMSLYETQAKVYEEEMVAYQEELSKWNITRNSAVKGAEGLIENVTAEFGWAWVDKDDPKIFWPWIIRTWVAQLIIISVYFVAILVLMKRKDAI